MFAPYDDHEEERENLFREAALQVLPLIQAAIAHVLATKPHTVGWAQVTFALGVESRSLSDVAAEHGVERACISKGAKEFIRKNNLPTPSCMKSEQASKSYSSAREANLKPL